MDTYSVVIAGDHVAIGNVLANAIPFVCVVVRAPVLFEVSRISIVLGKFELTGHAVRMWVQFIAGCVIVEILFVAAQFGSIETVVILARELAIGRVVAVVEIVGRVDLIVLSGVE